MVSVAGWKRWHNLINPVDVNNDLVVSPIDALVVINQLNSPEHRVLSNNRALLSPFVDTDGDWSLSPPYHISLSAK